MGAYRVVATSHPSKAARADGDPLARTSTWVRVSLGPAEVFNPYDRDVLRIRWLSDSGDPTWRVRWEDFVEVSPGLSLPRTLCFRIHCRKASHGNDDHADQGPARAELTAWSMRLPSGHTQALPIV